jgi:hypothetical protein
MPLCCVHRSVLSGSREVYRRVKVSGLVLLALALAGATPLIRDLVNQSQGKCDYMPCVWPWTLPVLAGYAALIAVGAILLTWPRLRRRLHRKS